MITRPKKLTSQCEKKSILCFYKPYMSLKLETGARTLLLNEEDNIRLLDLQNYIVHESKSMFRKAVILEPIVKPSNPWDTLGREVLILPDEQYKEIYNEIFNCIIDIRNE